VIFNTLTNKSQLLQTNSNKLARPEHIRQLA